MFQGSDTNTECIVVADGGRARLYLLRPSDRIAPTSASDKPLELVEVRALVRPDARVPAHERYTDSRPGTRRSSGGGPDHGVDDHRDANHAEHGRQFAGQVAKEAAEVAEEASCRRVTVVAGPQTLGVLRPQYGELRKNGREVRELDKDLTQLAPAALHDHLAKAGLVPARSRAGR